MLICDWCGKLLEEDDLLVYEDTDYVGGMCVRREFIAESCTCGGEFVEAKKCKFCDEYIADGEICKNCENELKEKYGEDWEDYV